MSKGKVILLYSCSGLFEKYLLDAGFEVHSFDGQLKDETIESSTGGTWFKHNAWFSATHIIQQSAEIIQRVKNMGDTSLPIVLVGGFPPCDDLAVSGSRHFAKKLEKNPYCQWEATERAKLVEEVGKQAKCPWFAENPVSVLASLWRKPDYYFEPYEYGGYLPDNDVHPTYPEHIMPRDAYPKKTCLWTGNGFTMPEKKPVMVPRKADGSVAYSEQYKKLGGKSLKTKNIRSATPRGFAKAVTQHLEKMV